MFAGVFKSGELFALSRCDGCLSGAKAFLFYSACLVAYSNMLGNIARVFQVAFVAVFMALCFYLFICLFLLNFLFYYMVLLEKYVCRIYEPTLFFIPILHYQICISKLNIDFLVVINVRVITCLRFKGWFCICNL